MLYYHELTELTNYLPHVRNYNVAVQEEGQLDVDSLSPLEALNKLYALKQMLGE